MSETNRNSASRKRKPPGRTAGTVALTVGKVLGTLLLIGITTCAILACFATVYIKSVIIPQAEINADNFDLNLSSTIYYTDPATGQPKELQTLHGGENRVWVAYDEIPIDMVHAAVAVEDKRFYQHNGVDWWRTGGAFVNMFLGMRNNFGGSTLTQQLIKNITDQDDVTVKRKILEIFRALEFEKKHPKEEILEWYLNYIYLGEDCYGVSTASYTYFGKPVSELSLAECASLIGITNNPSMYDPYISEKSKQNNKERQETILFLMEEQGYITQEEYDAAIAQELVFQRGEDESRPTIIYSWYEDQVIRDVVADLQKSQHWSEQVAKRAVYSGGLSIYCNLNPQIQAVVDEIYENQENLPYKSSAGQSMQSAITIIDNETGAVLAISGGMGEKGKSLLFNRATKAMRPPGSSIKPIAVYAPALDMGLITPATVVDDSPYSKESSGPWPSNSFNYYKGLTTVYDGVEQSVNTVAVKVLANYMTPDVSYEFLTGKMGITTLEAGRDVNGKTFTDIAVAPLALGGLTDGATTLEMAAAYSAFPRGGEYIAPRTYSRVVAGDGTTVLLDNEPERHVAMKDTTAWYITYLLKNAAANGTGRQATFPGMSIAGKTGTTSSRKDLWFVGYTPYYTAAVWTGYDQQERMGSSLQQTATTMWKKVMSAVHKDLENKEFPQPVSAGIVTKSYCKDSGLIPTEYCGIDPRGGRVTQGSFIQGDEPSQYCTVHTEESVVTLCLDSPMQNANGENIGMYHLAGPYCPEESRRKVAMVDYTREGAATLSGTRDHIFMGSYLVGLGDAANCTVHTQAPVIPEPTPGIPEDPDNTETPGANPGGIDRWDPTTWPSTEEYPNFNPFDETTWPGYQPPQATPSPVPPAQPDENEPFVPAVN